MKLKKQVLKAGKLVTEWVHIEWGDHAPACEKCRTVDLDKSASFVHACAQGSALIAEELKKRQAPVAAKKAAEVREWAKQAGFDIGHGVSKDKLKQITKYVE